MRAGRILAGVEAALIDLFDTLVWSEWRILRERFGEAIGVSPKVVSRAYEATYHLRQTGGYESPEAVTVALVEACELEPEPAFVRELTDLVADHLVHHVTLYEDALPALRGLREAGVRTALVSNCDNFAEPLVERLGLADELDEVVLSFRVGAKKPEPAIYRAALEALGAEPEHALFVDDQPEYLDGAAALGIQTRYIRRGVEPWEGHHDPGDHLPITRLTALL